MSSFFEHEVSILLEIIRFTKLFQVLECRMQSWISSPNIKLLKKQTNQRNKIVNLVFFFFYPRDKELRCLSSCKINWLKLGKAPLFFLPVTTSLGIPGTNFLGKAKNPLTFCWPRLNNQVLFSVLGKFFQRIRSLNFIFDSHLSNCNVTI